MNQSFIKKDSVKSHFIRYESMSWKLYKNNFLFFILNFMSKGMALGMITILISYPILSLSTFLGFGLSTAFAGEGHEDCFMCHSAHTAKDLALFPESIKDSIKNPHTGQKMDRIDALCMKCHAKPPFGKGIKEIDPNQKHPFGIKPVLVNLPDQTVGFGGENDRLACMGCHDPHPSNQNLGYLRTPSGVKISEPDDVIQSCLWCHPNMKSVFDVLPKKASKKSGTNKKSKPNIPPAIGGGGFEFFSN